MRQLAITFLLIIFVLSFGQIPSVAYIKGNVEYSIPTDYEKLSEQELADKANKYFFLAEKYEDGIVNEDITNALFLYSVLQHKNPENIIYAVRQGVLYDKIGVDRYAKGCFSKAISINKTIPEPYFYFGEYYYKREEYRKALKYYNEAYNKGFVTNYNLLYKMGDIYEKFGDTRSSLKYLNEAKKQSPNPELENKIKRVESQDLINKEYYSDTRIRIKEN